MCTAALVSLAILKVNRDRLGRDYIENFVPFVGEALRQSTDDVVSLPQLQEGLEGRSDEEVFARAWAEDRILLTHDTDFLDDRRCPPHRNPGVVVLPGAEGGDTPLLTALAGVVSFVAPFREGYRRAKVAVTADAVWTFVRRDPDTGAMEQRRFRIPPGRPKEVWIDG